MQGLICRASTQRVIIYLQRTIMSAALTQSLQRFSGQTVACKRPVTRTRLSFTPCSGFACPAFGRGLHAQRSVQMLRAARAADQSASNLAPATEESTQPISDEQQAISRDKLHATPEVPASAIDGSGPPEGDKDSEMLNMAAASQPEALLVSEGSQLPAGVTVEAVPHTAADAEPEAVPEQTAAPEPTAPLKAASISEAAAVPQSAQPESSAPVNNSAPSQQVTLDWDTVLQQFLDMLLSRGHYSSTVRATSFSIAVLKKGILDFARSRQDILFVLPEAKVKAVLEAGVPYEERKVYPHLHDGISLQALI